MNSLVGHRRHPGQANRAASDRQLKSPAYPSIAAIHQQATKQHTQHTHTHGRRFEKLLQTTSETARSAVKAECARGGAAGPQGLAGLLDPSTVVQVTQASANGSKTATALCPLTSDPNDDPTARTYAISGGFTGVGGSITESYRSNSGHGWTATQSSASGFTLYAYCVG